MSEKRLQDSGEDTAMSKAEKSCLSMESGKARPSSGVVRLEPWGAWNSLKCSEARLRVVSISKTYREQDLTGVNGGSQPEVLHRFSAQTDRRARSTTMQPTHQQHGSSLLSMDSASWASGAELEHSYRRDGS
jgi:hypothetical protein